MTSTTNFSSDHATPQESLQVAQDVIRALSAGATLDEAVRIVAHRIYDRLAPCEVLALLYHDGDVRLRMRLGEAGVQRSPVTMRGGLSLEGWVLSHREPLYVEDIDHDPRLSTLAHEGERVEAFIAAPVLVEHEVVGVFSVSLPRPYSAVDRQILSSSADVAAFIVEQDRLVKRACDSAIEQFIRVVRHDLKNPLAALNGYAQLVQRRATREGRDADVQSAATMLAQVQRMTGMLYDVTATGVREQDRWVETGLKDQARHSSQNA